MRHILSGVPNKLSLPELWEIKAKEYFDASRDHQGIPTKTLSECQFEVREDFGFSELDQYNKQHKKRWNTILSEAHQVGWADGTSDYSRVCLLCDGNCQYPVHTERYGEIKTPKFYEILDNVDEYFDENGKFMGEKPETGMLDTGYVDERIEDSL